MPPGHGIDPTANDFSNRGPGEHRQPRENSAELHTQVQPEQLNALVGQLNQSADRHLRQAEESDEIPEQQLQQQRNLSNQGDIAPRQPAQQTVGAVASRTRRDTQQRGQHQTRKDHLEAVEPADGQRPEVRVRGGVRERCFRQGEARWTSQPTEAEAQTRADQIDGQIIDQQAEQGE